MGQRSKARETEGRRKSRSSRKLAEKRVRREERTVSKKRGRDWTPIAYVSMIVTLVLGGWCSWPTSAAASPNRSTLQLALSATGR